MKNLSHFPKTDVHFWQHSIFRKGYTVSAPPLNLRLLGQGIASLPGSPSGARSNMSDAGSRSSFQGASPGS
jgi:hypothetical protein